jgi:hypothetical protein
MDKYGNLGVVMVATYLAVRYVTKSRIGLVLLVAAVSVAAYRHRRPSPGAEGGSVRARPVATSLAETQPATAPGQPAAPIERDPDQASFSVGRDQWRFVVNRVSNSEAFEADLRIYKNGGMVCRLRAEQLDGEGLAVKRVSFPTRYPVMAVLAYPDAGHPTATHFYTTRAGRLVHMGEVGAENGGPVFHDYDGDGRPEWVFDDYDWCEYYTRGPAFYLVYKETREGKLHLWRRLPNLKRRHLPDRIGIVGEYSGTG